MQHEKLLTVNNHFQLQWEKRQDCFVLLYPEGMVQLSQSAGEIMNLCDGIRTINDIVKILEEKFQTTGLYDDIKDFLIEAKEKKWILENE